MPRLILDEFVALTGYHRKHAIRVLNGSSAMPAVRRGRRAVYDEAVTEGLVVLWEASDRVCGKRLKALLPTLVPALERHGHVTLDPRVREQLMAVSAATIDRRLASARAVTAGQRRRRRSGGDRVRGRVPVRTFGDWQDPAPGFVEADLVAHCGSSMAGSFAWTLVLTDIASGWTECVPLLVREAGVVVDAVDRLRGALPFPLRGIDTDNGSEFLNEVLIGFCKEHGIKLTRSRPVPRRCCVTEPRRRFERLGFRLSAIDPDPGGRDRVAAGRPACQRAARVLRCATALRTPHHLASPAGEKVRSQASSRSVRSPGAEPPSPVVT